MNRCPNGHYTSATDYCDICGAPVDAAGAAGAPAGDAAQVLGERACVAVVDDLHVGPGQPGAQEPAEGDVAPAEVGGEPDGAVGVPGDAGDGHAEAGDPARRGGGELGDHRRHQVGGGLRRAVGQRTAVASQDRAAQPDEGDLDLVDADLGREDLDAERARPDDGGGPTTARGDGPRAGGRLLDHPEASILQLMNFIPGPDFPTGGVIHGRDGIADGYMTSRGKVTLRARAEIVEEGRERCIIVR